MPIAQFEGRALVFNNGVIDVRQGDTSLVDSEKVAHIPEGNVAIDNETIIKNANNELEVPIDENTIYIDQDGFMKAKGAEVHDSKIILCTQVGSDPAGPVGSFTLNQASNKTITIPIPEGGSSYTAGENISISSEGVISAVDTKYTAGTNITIENNVISASGGGGSSYTAGANIQISSEGVISAIDTTYSAGTGISISSEGVIASTITYSYDSNTKTLSITSM